MTGDQKTNHHVKALCVTDTVGIQRMPQSKAVLTDF